ncbi:hypothetical protein SAMN05216582_103100 [Selenomonas ruminantium]|uniref:Uncharacterized protein n=1 Tax=Selenomonas ruminantium TaxID=971 RepID=A0A1M6S3W5_SELRU|nr:hypothetical protein [Selenomonas ruminantium]SHK39443.1 hypothetical protein SAMN05216582_103100 [Selenomonas ruminantium]
MGPFRKKLQTSLQNETGQVLTEFALVVVFILGIVGIIYNSGLDLHSQTLYEKVVSYLQGTPTYSQAVSTYGTISNEELRKIDNNERIVMDQTALENLARAFLGKNKETIRSMLDNTGTNIDSGFAAYNPNKGLSQCMLLFDYYIKNTGDGENAQVKTKFDNAKAHPQDIINWMQGNYTEQNTNDKSMTSNSRYFFSDDLIDPSGVLHDEEHEAGEYAVSVRCAFTWDSNQNATSVRIWATRNKKKNNTNPVEWLRYEADGMFDIIVQ